MEREKVWKKERTQREDGRKNRWSGITNHSSYWRVLNKRFVPVSTSWSFCFPSINSSLFYPIFFLSKFTPSWKWVREERENKREGASWDNCDLVRKEKQLISIQTFLLLGNQDSQVYTFSSLHWKWLLFKHEYSYGINVLVCKLTFEWWLFE